MRSGLASRLRHRAEETATRLPPLQVAAERVAATIAQGVHGRRRVGVGESFWQFRPYQHGDAASEIDWRQSAKGDRLFIRQNEWDAADSVWLWRDGSPSMDWQSSFAPLQKRERADLLLLALAILLVRGGERVALLDGPFPPDGSRVVLDRLCQSLLQPLTPQAPSLPPAKDLPRYAALVLFSDFLNPLAPLTERIEAYAARGLRGTLVQILDPAEEDLPFAGRTRFLGLEGEGDLVIGRVETLQDDYRRKFAEHQAALRDLTRRLGWRYLRHRTDHRPEPALLALHADISQALPGQGGRR